MARNTSRNELRIYMKSSEMTTRKHTSLFIVFRLSTVHARACELNRKNKRTATLLQRQPPKVHRQEFSLRTVRQDREHTRDGRHTKNSISRIRVCKNNYVVSHLSLSPSFSIACRKLRERDPNQVQFFLRRRLEPVPVGLQGKK